MSKSLRIDSVSEINDGALLVGYTSGTPPLQPTESGSSFIFASRQALKNGMTDFENSISNEQLAFFALSPWVKADPDMSNLNIPKNNQAQLDLTGNEEAIVVG